MSYSATILADSPVVYYRLDEDGGLVAIDVTTSHYNAALSSDVMLGQAGAMTGAGDSDTAIAFLGSGTLTLPYTLNPSAWNALSLEYWINLGDGWQYVVVTCDATGTTLYLNGTLSAGGSGNPVLIDIDISYAGSYLPGTLDEVALYHYRLTPSQIQAHYLAAGNPVIQVPQRTGSGGGEITPIRFPVLPYMVNGTVLPDQPIFTTAPLTMAGNVIPVGSTFALLFPSPSNATQSLLVNGSTVSMQFGLPDMSSVTGQVAITSTMNYTGLVLSDRPVAYYRLDESSGLVAHDLTANHYDGTLSGTITPGQTGAIAGDADTAVLFGGASLLSLPYRLNPSTFQAASLEYWINLTSGWQHIVVTCNASATTIYLNGSVYTSGAGDIILIDRGIFYAGSNAAGRLDEVALYNYVLTPTQIQAHYQAGTTAATNIMLQAVMRVVAPITINRYVIQTQFF